MARTIEELEDKRAEVLKQIEEVGDMRRGSIAERYRECGKHPCCCEEAAHPGHGPYYSLTVKAAGTTVTRHLAPGVELAKVEREIAAFRRFQELVPELVAVNEEICEARPSAEPGGDSIERRTVKKNCRARPGGGCARGRSDNAPLPCGAQRRSAGPGGRRVRGESCDAQGGQWAVGAVTQRRPRRP